MKNPTDVAKFQSLLLENPDPGYALCKNVNLIKDELGLTLDDIVEGTGLPSNTVKAVLYYENKDYKLTTALKLARFFGVSVDELIGSDCMSHETKTAIQEVRLMPDANREFFYWLIAFVHNNLNSHKNTQKVIPVLCPSFKDECLSFSAKEFMEKLDVSEYSDLKRPKLFMGIKIPSDCRAFLPAFCPGEILLLAYDRQPLNNEIVALTTEGHVWFARYIVKSIDIESGFYSIYGQHKIPANELDCIIGYVAAIHTP